ncbi:MAG TPA: NAD-glutamate dehydrogenase, partial [Holosporales bacterium]|nr:NAD-glutamate dehydrogenase [Holosporales bacterium]
MSKRDLTQEERKTALLDKIAKKVAVKASVPLKKEAEIFARLFYGNVSLEDLTETPLDALEYAAFEMWEFGFEHKPGQSKIKCFVEKREVKRTKISKTVIELINDNMPFLVDSVAGAINSLGYSIHLIVHPVMAIDRDRSHRLKKVYDRVHKNKGGNYESFIRCEILGPSSASKLKVLKQEIERSLKDVQASVQDWASMRTQLRGAITNLKKTPPHISKEELKETTYFLDWTEDNHFTFLGYCKYSLSSESKTTKRIFSPENGLGILRNPEKQEVVHIFEGVELDSTIWHFIMDSDPLILTKTIQLSLVHRRDPMDSITVKRFDKNGDVVGLDQFIGLFTSVAYSQSAREIPLLRRKMSRILKRSGFSEHWHDGKTLLHILESFPRDELFQASEDWLFNTAMAVLQLQNRQRLTLFIRPDKFERFVTCLVYVPRDRYDSELRQRISEILEKELKGKVTNWQTQLGDLAFARIHFSLQLPQQEHLTYDLKAIENELVEASLTWRDNLQKVLLSAEGEEKGQALFEKYSLGFSKGYQEKFTIKEAVRDILEVEKVFSEGEIRAFLSRANGQENNRLKFKIYCMTGPVFLSDVLQLLENMNLRVLSETPFLINFTNEKKAWIHDFEVETHEGDPVDLKHISNHFLDGFYRIWQNEVENDGFNRLIIRAKFTWRECQLIRAYAKYIRQLRVTFSQIYMEEVLAKSPHVCHLLIQLHTFLFCPDCKEDRIRAKEEILLRINTLLDEVKNLDEDRILRKFVNVITSTLRTNYYQLENKKPKSYLSFKINSKEIDEMPLPRPLYEIFVYSSRVEAIHLRGGKVARGGIRWSDRREDFRTEVLSLMKAQTIKNAVIVPVGSKGGFVVKQLPPSDDTAAVKTEVISCYKTMIRGLLDLTDNVVDEEVVSPPNVIKRDDDAPYLVVAADKGTSSFSDIANQISADYNFWLNDAFASGGSTGYDHKKMGITSRGAWESVKRHFREMGMDATREKITVVGVGDMSGDVFGNGMLLSHHLRLQAAFNHLHIFIDPNPDPEKSYQERRRLFNLPQSSWDDYNPILISEGGGVFDRKAKSIAITPEIQQLLDIREEHLIPSELITYILKAPVELIWFGGIGTFIKAKNESSVEVDDRANDAIRINGADARAKVIIEGANLAVTQLGRIEYAKSGGRINTDAIDNSAGVDCSDHEVNIKILLNQAMIKNGLTLKKRNILLDEMTDDVARLVLKDNFWQNQILSLAQSHG